MSVHLLGHPGFKVLMLQGGVHVKITYKVLDPGTNYEQCTDKSNTGKVEVCWQTDEQADKWTGLK